MKGYILAIDQGTTGTKAVVFNKTGRPVASAYAEFTQYYPRPGWVEHNPEEIWRVTMDVVREALKKGSVDAGNIVALGIANQRETTLIWDRETGKPVCNAIVWQCRRTASICDELRVCGLEQTFQEKTGLVLDPYFSGTKIKWILDNLPDVRQRAKRDELAFGTVDSWLIFKLTGGTAHVTDYTNASRTLVFNIHNLSWDEELLELLGIPAGLMPEVKPSSGVFAATDPDLFGASVPIGGMAGDQQAATFGQVCLDKGMAKNTYGTGCFILLNTGEKPVLSRRGLLTTIGWSLNGKVFYALEGSIFAAGAVVQWLRDGLRIIDEAEDTEWYATSIEDTGGVYFVPAFVGLGAPHWDMYARGTLVGITRGTGKKQIIRAALEAIAYQTRDVLEVMEKDAAIKLKTLRVDGGAAANNFLMQFQADILGVDVERPEVTETTALGAAFLAGLAVGYWSSQAEIADTWRRDRVFRPTMAKEKQEGLYAGWQKAVKCCRSWTG